MSAIIDEPTNAYGISRFHTKIKVVVHSHLSAEPIYLSDDVVACQLSKTVKGPGQCNLTVLPRLNYVNLLFPNDYINVYFNIGDGNGWTRTFFGLIDRIEESYAVGEDGAPNTTYTVVATDFAKIFTRTEVYNNPNIAQRRDIQGTEFGAINIGGLFLMTKGITMHGTPDTIVLNTILVLLGFGSQFIMPSCYPIAKDTLREARIQRQQAALRLIQSKINPEKFTALRDRIVNETTQEAANLLKSGNTEDILRTLAEKYGVTLTNLEIEGANEDTLAGLMSSARLSQVLNIPSGLGGPLQGFAAIDRTTRSSAIPTVLDYVDLFSFVEREALDGYVSTTTILDQQGPIMSMLATFSNESVNELMFDLRPRHQIDLVSKDSYSNELFYSTSPHAWDRSLDDLEGNAPDHNYTNDKPGIKYVPALIMREYPFSTIDSVDANDVPISIATVNNTADSAAERNAVNSRSNVETIGPIFMGAIFSDNPNVPGRHYLLTPNINVEDIAQNVGPAYGRKILDVAVVSDKEIRESKFGRSDEDHVNFLEMWSDSFGLGSDARYFMQDISPVITPIQVMRHGLRKRAVTTTFNRYDRHAVQNTAAVNPTTVNTPTASESGTQASAGGSTTEDNGAPRATSTENAANITGAGTQASASSITVTEQLAASGGSAAAPSTTSTSTINSSVSFASTDSVWPVNRIVDGNPIKSISSGFGYRRMDNSNGNSVPPSRFDPVSSGGRENPNGSTTPSKRWKFHSGVDIAAPPGTSVHAVRKGKVVIVGLAGMYTRYGNIVGILHDDGNLSMYAHLESISPKFADPVRAAVASRLGPRPSGDKLKRARYLGVSPLIGTRTDRLLSPACMNAVDVMPGEVIGKVGRTKDVDAQGKLSLFDAAHLHFEWCNHFPSKKKSITPDRNGDLPANSPYLEYDAQRLFCYDPADRQGLNIRSFRHPNDGVSYDVASEPFASDSQFEGNDFDDNTFETDQNPANQQAAMTSTTQVTAVAQPATNQVPTDTPPTPESTSPSTQEQVAPDRASLVTVPDGISSRRQLARWVLLQDHWYQHNIEYLSGSLTMRPAPEIRVGYRLDIRERNMSFYVEGVTHSWTYPNAMTTTLSVTRGQPNNPYPIYVYPGTDGFNPTQIQRKQGSRLGKYFITPDPVAVQRSLALRMNGNTIRTPSQPANGVNTVDMPENNRNENFSSYYSSYVSRPEVTKTNTNQGNLGGSSTVTQDSTVQTSQGAT